MKPMEDKTTFQMVLFLMYNGLPCNRNRMEVDRFNNALGKPKNNQKENVPDVMDLFTKNVWL